VALASRAVHAPVAAEPDSSRSEITFSFIVWPEEGAPGQILEGQDRESLLVQALALVKAGGVIVERRRSGLTRIHPGAWSGRPG